MARGQGSGPRGRGGPAAFRVPPEKRPSVSPCSLPLPRAVAQKTYLCGSDGSKWDLPGGNGHCTRHLPVWEQHRCFYCCVSCAAWPHVGVYVFFAQSREGMDSPPERPPVGRPPWSGPGSGPQRTAEAATPGACPRGAGCGGAGTACSGSSGCVCPGAGPPEHPPRLGILVSATRCQQQPLCSWGGIQKLPDQAAGPPGDRRVLDGEPQP